LFDQLKRLISRDNAIEQYYIIVSVLNIYVDTNYDTHRTKAMNVTESVT